jgi:uncharacterized protein YPO0396
MPLKHHEAHAGYRLERYEILNWGTFNQQIWILEPQGETTLLTGNNGSGKSTLVDGLLTLLVSNDHNRRNYNQAAGSDQRKERSEQSYVAGAYAQSSELNAEGRQTTLKLRPDDTYTILLAVFANRATGKAFTLAQVLYIVNREYHKFFVTASQPLSIQEHFQLPASGTLRDLRRQLKSLPGAEVYDTFKDYGAYIRKHFNLRSEKAMELFNQIVSIKEIGDLNEFVRKHMLEEEDVRASIDTLRGNYQDLTAAHQAIIKAKMQLSMLGSLTKDGKNYREYSQRIQDLERQLQLIPYAFDHLQFELLSTAIEADTHTLEVEQERHQQTSQALNELRDREKQVYADLQNNQVANRIKELENEIKYAIGRRDEKQRQLNEYGRLAKQLRLPSAETPEVFINNQSHIQARQEDINQRIEGLRAEQTRLSIEGNQLQIRVQELRDEIDDLSRRKSQIPSKELRVRQFICESLQLDEQELPYTGELLHVRDSAYEWEGAIQRLLNGFARRLLVPESHYKRVRTFVNQQHLGGRLIYYRIGRQPHYVSVSRLREESLFHKLQIHPETPYQHWLQDRLIADYDYICCQNLEQFDREERGLTASGQIKHGHERYEKDDRARIDDRANYALGWNNEQKIEALSVLLKEQERQAAEVREQLNEAAQSEIRLRGFLKAAEDLLKFDAFARLDVQTEVQLIAGYTQERQQLLASSDQYRALEAQYEQITAEIKVTETILRQIDAIVTTCQNALKQYRERQQSCQRRLAQMDAQQFATDFDQIYADVSAQPTLNNLEELRRDLEEQYTGSRHSLRGTQTRVQTAIEKTMQDFMRAYPQETEEVDGRVESLQWYLDKIQRLEKDDLPAHEERFRKLLNSNIRQSLNVFRAQLEKREGEIRKRIEQLNLALSRIDYTTTTYIRLIVKPTQQQEIQHFRGLLRSSYPDIGGDEGDNNERVFTNVQQLIDRFEKDPAWMRRVTDVRNWLDFSAEERLKSDNSVHEYYQSSSGKSGGQKAKLAYTILASAIADQYGLNEADLHDQTFRFVVIDEVFSKSDEANSRYAMDLFKQLGLQVLVVTPADKIQIVEPYIGSCHYVWNNEAGNNSQLQTITVEQIHQKRLGA